MKGTPPPRRFRCEDSCLCPGSAADLTINIIDPDRVPMRWSMAATGERARRWRRPSGQGARFHAPPHMIMMRAPIVLPAPRITVYSRIRVINSDVCVCRLLLHRLWRAFKPSSTWRRPTRYASTCRCPSPTRFASPRAPAPTAHGHFFHASKNMFAALICVPRAFCVRRALKSPLRVRRCSMLLLEGLSSTPRTKIWGWGWVGWSGWALGR